MRGSKKHVHVEFLTLIVNTITRLRIIIIRSAKESQLLYTNSNTVEPCVYNGHIVHLQTANIIIMNTLLYIASLNEPQLRTNTNHNVTGESVEWVICLVKPPL